MYKFIAATVLAASFALPAAAQSNNSASNGTSSSSTSSQSNVAVQQKIKSDLQQQGFTQVQVMPESFLVRAHDKQNRPVLMVINPDSVTAVTQVAAPPGSGSGQSSSNGTTKTQ